MTTPNKNVQQSQNANAGRNVYQVGRDYESTTSINVSLWISILLISIVATGSYVYFGTDGLSEFFPKAPQPEGQALPN